MNIIEILGTHRAVDYLNAELIRSYNTVSDPVILRDSRLANEELSILRLTHDQHSEVPDRNGLRNTRLLRAVSNILRSASDAGEDIRLITLSESDDNHNRSYHHSAIEYIRETDYVL